MEFWIFMLIMDLLLPFTMIGFGRYFMKKAPKEINSVFGYRTSMSMRIKTHGNLLINIAVKLVCLWNGYVANNSNIHAFSNWKSEDCVGSMGGIICGVQLIPLIGSILPTEIALKKNFDKNGTRR